MKNAHLITGGTGFVGSAIILELLQKSESLIYCIVRPRKDISTTERLHKILNEVTALYKLPESLYAAIKNRCIGIAGDLTADLSTVQDQIEHPIEQFWHVAASLNYEERYAEEIKAINVDGTAKALKLAQKLNVEFFNHFSTAYVAGMSTGVIKETAVTEVTSNNTYEWSKVKGEALVQSCKTIKTRIFRPSIVIGHSQTKGAINFSGMYGFLRRLIQFNGIMDRVQEGFFKQNRLKMASDSDVPLNFVPIDLVAKEAVEIGLSRTELDFFHLSNPNVLSVGMSVDILFRLANMSTPEYIKDKLKFNSIDERFNRKIDFYASYLRGYKTFSKANCQAVLGEIDYTPYAITEENLLEYAGWYASQLKKKRKALPVMR